MEEENAGSAHAFLRVTINCDPIREYRALALPDRAFSLKADARHEALGRAYVSREIGEAIEEAEAIAEADVGGGDVGESFVAFAGAGNHPRAEPGIHCGRRICKDLARYRVAEQGKLEAPSLHMFIAGWGLREFMEQVEAGSSLVGR